MSERVYEDGTPATYEPRTDIISCRMRPEAEMLREMIERQLIRRGDVVQAVKNYETNEGNQIAKGDCFTALQVSPYGDVTISGLLSRIPGYVVARIGRARYYPDGTPVED